MKKIKKVLLILTIMVMTSCIMPYYSGYRPAVYDPYYYPSYRYYYPNYGSHYYYPGYGYEVPNYGYREGNYGPNRNYPNRHAPVRRK